MSSRNIYIIIAIIIIVVMAVVADTKKENIIVNNPQQITDLPIQKISNINNTISDNMYKVNEDMRYIGRNFNSYNNDIDKKEKQLAVFHCGVDVVNSSWKDYARSIKSYESYEDWRKRDWKEFSPYSTQEFIKNNINTPYHQIK